MTRYLQSSRARARHAALSRGGSTVRKGDEYHRDLTGEEPADGEWRAGGAQTEADVTCPYCGEPGVIGLDPGGGPTQEYVEDCQVCCRPWQVRIQYDDTGTADVRLAESD